VTIRIPPPPPVPDHLESYVLRDVLIHTSAIPGAMVWRENSGLYYTPTATGFRRVRASIPGCSDIIGLVSLSVPRLHELGIARIGAFLGVETKTATGRLRESQREFRDAVLSNDGIYVVARRPEDVDAALGRYL
jgi:hypothetical protein